MSWQWQWQRPYPGRGLVLALNLSPGKVATSKKRKAFLDGVDDDDDDNFDEEDSGSDFDDDEDPDLIEVPGGGRDLNTAVTYAQNIRSGVGVTKGPAGSNSNSSSDTKTITISNHNNNNKPTSLLRTNNNNITTSSSYNIKIGVPGTAAAGLKGVPIVKAVGAGAGAAVGAGTVGLELTSQGSVLIIARKVGLENSFKQYAKEIDGELCRRRCRSRCRWCCPAGGASLQGSCFQGGHATSERHSCSSRRGSRRRSTYWRRWHKGQHIDDGGCPETDCHESGISDQRHTQQCVPDVHAINEAYPLARHLLDVRHQSRAHVDVHVHVDAAVHAAGPGQCSSSLRRRRSGCLCSAGGGRSGLRGDGCGRDICRLLASQTGVGAMEIVAMDMKLRGMYIARQLSFKGVSFKIEEVPLTKEFRKIYDQSVELWVEAMQKFTEAAELIDAESRMKKTMWGQFWSSHQRFFKYLCIAAKVNHAVLVARESIKYGKCVVIGLQSTGEARTLDQLERDDGELTDFVSTAKGVFQSFVERHFPAPDRNRINRILGLYDDTPTPLSAGTETAASNNNNNNNNNGKNGGRGKRKGDGVQTKSSQKKKKMSAGAAWQMSDSDEEAARTPSRDFGANSNSDSEGADSETFAEDDDEEDEDEDEEDADEELDRDSDRRSVASDASSDFNPFFSGSDSDIDPWVNARSKKPTKKVQKKVKKKVKKEKKESQPASASTPALSATTGEASASSSSVMSPAVVAALTAAKTRKSQQSTQDKIQDLLQKKQELKGTVTPVGVNGVKLNYGPPPKDAIERACTMKEELLRKIERLGSRLPPNTLDQLIDELGGPDNVAEMTGRRGRVVQNEDGSIQYESRTESDVPLETLNITEKQRFMDGQKDVAIISEAASSGISLQSDRRVFNQRRRVHITLELPWSADRAIQQFGRTHRSNQVNAPEYIFLISDLAGERRFASTVAKRLESLGALTHGDRRATETRDLSQFNIDNKYGRQALETVMRTIMGYEAPLVPPPTDYNGEFFKDIAGALVGVGIIVNSESNPGVLSLDKDYNNISKFLNRILGCPVDLQNRLFKYFTDTMTAIINQAKRGGRFDLGIVDLGAAGENVIRVRLIRFVRKHATGVAPTELHTVRVERGMIWQEAIDKYADLFNDNEGFYLSHQLRNQKRTAILVVVLEHQPPRNSSSSSTSTTDADGGSSGSNSKKKKSRSKREIMCQIYRPNTGLQVRHESLFELEKKYRKVASDDAEPHWTEQYDASVNTCSHAYWNGNCRNVSLGNDCEVGLRQRLYHVLAGSVLSVWGRVEHILNTRSNSKMQVIRMKTTEGEKIVGTMIPKSCFDLLMNDLSSDSEKKEEFNH
ncbi:GL15866 [Drosophila persimilis]|uniref:GL15866 n=1 Tax=Drosophila persimilis TaxID=7234 RepID=B4H0W1_DROPE|nr:GL15866 [Drosophila persimilis]